jgi:hypothetical protein
MSLETDCIVAMGRTQNRSTGYLCSPVFIRGSLAFLERNSDLGP